MEGYLGKDKKLHAAFMDLEKAYDRDDREALWSVLKIYGVGGQLLTLSVRRTNIFVLVATQLHPVDKCIRPVPTRPILDDPSAEDIIASCFTH